jgi:predicted DNA-binding transcriptional regulator YafY
VEFDAPFARAMAETRWHPTQTITPHPDGSCLFECEVDGLDEIVWWILGYGPHARILHPTALRDMARDLINLAAQLYEDSNHSPPANQIATGSRYALAAP